MWDLAQRRWWCRFWTWFAKEIPLPTVSCLKLSLFLGFFYLHKWSVVTVSQWILSTQICKPFFLKKFFSYEYSVQDRLQFEISHHISNVWFVFCAARFVGLVLSFTYTVLLYGIYVPDWEYQISGPGSVEKSFSVSAKCCCIFCILL
jgi:hypothetical protein